MSGKLYSVCWNRKPDKIKLIGKKKIIKIENLFGSMDGQFDILVSN